MATESIANFFPTYSSFQLFCFSRPIIFRCTETKRMRHPYYLCVISPSRLLRSRHPETVCTSYSTAITPFWKRDSEWGIQHRPEVRIADDDSPNLVLHRKNVLDLTNLYVEPEFKLLLSVCGGRFSTDHGVIMSTNYPQPYPANSDCSWAITVPNNHLVSMTFQDFDMGQSTNCTDNFVAVSSVIKPIFAKCK